MEVRIGKALIEKERKFFTELLKIDIDRDLRYDKFFEKDLRQLSKKQIDQLTKISADNSSLGRDVRGLYKDLVNFKFLQSNKDGIKTIRARTVKHACSLLIEFFLRYGPRKHIFEKIQEGDDSVSLAYFVESIKYVPPDKRRDYKRPEYISVNLVYKLFGVVESTSFNIEIGECLGLNAREMLLKCGYAWETAMLREDYEVYLDYYDKWWDKVGQQMLAVGTAEDHDNDDDNWYRRSSSKNKLKLDKDGEPARVVIDVFQESDKEEGRKRNDSYSQYFWNSQKSINYKDNEEATWKEDDEVEYEEMDQESKQEIEIPVHPYVVCFDLKRHKRLRVHVGNLELYKYNKEMRDQLVLPETNAKLIDVLLSEKDTHFKDIVKGKTGGIVIICQGPPGTGKTLTAEVYSEILERPLYNVQCAQLGVNAEELEDNLLKIFSRSRRWKAVMVLDEADVYVHSRGDDLIQNAIVGVFLRTLEYYDGVLFMTTNRGDLVDDAILSRCTARIPYGAPDVTQQHRIWRVLADINGVELTNRTIKEIVDQHSRLSGRDIKNLLKIAAMVSHDRGEKIDADLITEMKIFKPTIDTMEDEK